MSDDNDLTINIKKLVDVVSQQASVLATMAEQQRALFVVTATLLRELREQISIELVRSKALAVFSDSEQDAAAVDMVHAILGPTQTKEIRPTAEEERNHLREIARARFRVIEGDG